MIIIIYSLDTYLFIPSKQIMRVERIHSAKCRRPIVTQFHQAKLRFPMVHIVNQRISNSRLIARKRINLNN